MRDLYFMNYGYIKSLAILCTVLLLSACDGLNEGNASGKSGTGSGGSGPVGPGPGGSVPGSTPVIGSVTISWTPAVAKINGDPLSLADIRSHRVYYGTASGQYSNRVDVNDSTAQQTTIESEQGLYYFVVTTVDSGGRESVFSQEISTTI